MLDPRAVVVLIVVSLVVVGAKTVAHGVKVAAVKTSHAVVRVVKHPLHSVKHGAITAPPEKK